MRADRLLSLMLLLQSKEKMTAHELADSLEVSARTIYRDIEALSFAGVPIYTQDGRNGGVYLDKQYRISLTGLKREEIQSLFITQGPLRDIGLNDANENALLKLLAALPLRYREEAERTRQRIHFDGSQWFYARDVSQWMPLLLEAVFQQHKIHVRYMRSDATISERVVAPYGVVAKLDVWYLVAMTDDGEARTFRVSRLQALHLLDATFERDPAFDLAAYWAESARRYEAARPRYVLTLRVAPDAPGVVRYLTEAHGAAVAAPDQHGWTPVTLRLGAMQEARMIVMALGPKVDILDPPDLRDEVRSWLNVLRDQYDS